MIWDMLRLLLDKSWSNWISWVESGVITLLIHNPIDVVGSGCVGFLAPCNLVGLIVLVIVPGVLSLRVWGNVGSAITYWVDSLLSQSWGSWISWVES